MSAAKNSKTVQEKISRNPVIRKAPKNRTFRQITASSRTPVLAACATALIIIATTLFWLSPHTDMRTSLLNGEYNKAYQQALNAANNGDHPAENVLGNLYYLGLGVERNYKHAALWYQKSALGGYTPAQVNMGHLHSQGLGVEKDAVQTLGWYWLAKISGHKDVKKHLQVKLDELQLVPGQIQEAQQQFSSLEKVRKRIMKRSSPSKPSSRK